MQPFMNFGGPQLAAAPQMQPQLAAAPQMQLQPQPQPQPIQGVAAVLPRVVAPPMAMATHPGPMFQPVFQQQAAFQPGPGGHQLQPAFPAAGGFPPGVAWPPAQAGFVPPPVPIVPQGQVQLHAQAAAPAMDGLAMALAGLGIGVSDAQRQGLESKVRQLMDAVVDSESIRIIVEDELGRRLDDKQYVAIMSGVTKSELATYKQRLEQQRFFKERAVRLSGGAGSRPADGGREKSPSRSSSPRPRSSGRGGRRSPSDSRSSRSKTPEAPKHPPVDWDKLLDDPDAFAGKPMSFVRTDFKKKSRHPWTGYKLHTKSHAPVFLHKEVHDELVEKYTDGKLPATVNVTFDSCSDEYANAKSRFDLKEGVQFWIVKCTLKL